MFVCVCVLTKWCESQVIHSKQKEQEEQQQQKPYVLWVRVNFVPFFFSALSRRYFTFSPGKIWPCNRNISVPTLISLFVCTLLPDWSSSRERETESKRLVKEWCESGMTKLCWCCCLKFICFCCCLFSSLCIARIFCTLLAIDIAVVALDHRHAANFSFV